MRHGPVYIVKPKYIFKHPFNKYDLSNPTNRETQNQELTDYFNYGFNEDTMNIYGKLVKRNIQVLENRKFLQYFNQAPSNLMRLNDQIPMDFGGFCQFNDSTIITTDSDQNLQTGDNLMLYFIMMIFTNPNKKIQYPLIQFVKRMYKCQDEQPTRDNDLYQIVQQISKNIERKYLDTMEKLQKKTVQPKKEISIKKKKKDNKYGKGEQNHKKRKQKNSRSQNSESDSSDSYSDSYSDSRSDSGSSSPERRKKKERKRSHDHKKDSRKRSKDKKEKHSKTKKVKKDKYKRSKSKNKSHRENRDKDKKKKNRH